MKNSLFIILLIAFSNHSTFAQKEVSSKIKAVKVYQRQAQIQRVGSFTSSVGNQEIVLTGISTQIVPSSLQIEFDNQNAVLLSAKYENNYLKSNLQNKTAQTLQKQLDDLLDEQA